MWYNQGLAWGLISFTKSWPQKWKLTFESSLSSSVRAQPVTTWNWSAGTRAEKLILDFINKGGVSVSVERWNLVIYYWYSGDLRLSPPGHWPQANQVDWLILSLYWYWYWYFPTGVRLRHWPSRGRMLLWNRFLVESWLTVANSSSQPIHWSPLVDN